MNKLIILSLVICFGYFISDVYSFPPGIPKAKIEAFREMIKCSAEKCSEQNTALKSLFKDELDKCLKVCNLSDKKLNTLDDEERSKLKQCFKQNNCKLPVEHIKQHRDTPQFKALKQCSEDKCNDQYKKLKSLDFNPDRF